LTGNALAFRLIDHLIDHLSENPGVFSIVIVVLAIEMIYNGLTGRLAPDRDIDTAG
jgi:hypothetical protein